MNVFLVENDEQGRKWDAYVAQFPEGSHYHRWGWKRAIENGFRWPTYYLMAEEDGTVCGVLPLAWQKSWLFGSFVTSLPFLNGGGALASSREAEKALVDEAIAMARRLGAKHLELRYRHDPNLELPTKSNKVAVVRPVCADAEKMLAELPHKVRTDVRKTVKSGMAAEFCGEAALEDFYRIFATNMRDLGTPVYGRSFFREILRTFPSDTFICLVRHQGKPIAASFLMGYRETLESGWSCSLYDYISLKPNMFLYWKIFCLAGERGYRTFDFGRSSVGSGTHRFKMQWGSKEVPLYWAYWLAGGNQLPELNPDNPRYRLAIGLWRKMPVVLTRIVGPRIVRGLP